MLTWDMYEVKVLRRPPLSLDCAVVSYSVGSRLSLRCFLLKCFVILGEVWLKAVFPRIGLGWYFIVIVIVWMSSIVEITSLICKPAYVVVFLVYKGALVMIFSIHLKIFLFLIITPLIAHTYWNLLINHSNKF